MRGMQKSNQVRLFSSAKPPSDVGILAQNSLPAKASHRPVKLSKIPSTKWRYPPRFEVNSECQVVSGEESEELKSHNQRHRLRPSSIPPNRLAPPEGQFSNDRNTPPAPLTPIEDAEVTAAISVLASVLSKGSRDHQLIDPDLLIRILTNPKVLQQLATTSRGGSSGGTQCIPLEMKLQHDNIAVDRGAPPPPPNLSPPVKDISYYRSLIQQHGGGGGVALPESFGSGVVGTNVGFRKLRDEQKPRKIKPCIYFNTPRGCRNGANCSYQHDLLSSQQNISSVSEVQTAKRLKLSR